MNIEKIWLDGLQIGSRLRDVDQSRVESLAASMGAIGLRQPISVWADDDGGVHLVAGLHRVKAAELLKWETIDAIVVDMSAIDRRRWEIAENLHRAELTALERDQHVAEWERLTMESEKVRTVSAPGGKQPKEKGARKTARALGLDEKAVRDARKVASLTDEAKETAREVGLDDNRSALLRAAAEPPEQQAQMVREIAERKDRKKPDPDPTWGAEDEASYSDLLDAWEAATPAAKKQFLREHARRAAA